ncbi:MAG: NUDIX hydrolase [Gemmatimonadaceae bacterium]|nr:NUDIX hydrolase [Gemmatimonadaceae bacterium]
MTNEHDIMPRITRRAVAFVTPWFQVLERHVDDDPSPYYVVKPFDYASIIATDLEGRFLLVRQYRPALEAYTIELPSGLIDQGETPEVSARRELVEETGHQAEAMEFLGTVATDLGRIDNQMWCYLASGVRPVAAPAPLGEGIELIRCTPRELAAMIVDSRCNHALNLAALLLGVLKDRVKIPVLS